MQRRTRTIWLAMAGALALTGCGAPHLAAMREAKQRLVGEEVTGLYQCLGEPFATSQGIGPTGESLTTLRYSSAQPRGDDRRLQATPRSTADQQERACHFEIDAEDGRIVAVRSENLAGWGFGSIRACSAMIAPCRDR